MRRSKWTYAEELLDELEIAFDLTEENQSVIGDRQSFIESAYTEGGKGFVERVQRYGCTDKGEPLRLSRWFLEYLEAIGDFRLHHTLTTGCAQLGKTAAHTLLLVDVIMHGRLNAGWFYASRDSRDLNVQEQFRPVADGWIDRYAADTGVVLGQEADRKINSRWQVDGVTAIFSYTSTSKETPSRKGLAAAGGAAVSFTANVLFYEERSQWLPGTADPLPRRLDASLLPTKPIRELGTPGAGQGIEAELEHVDRYFYPHYRCTHCGTVAPLDPKGCLLRPIHKQLPSGETKTSYLSESGRPFARNRSNGSVEAYWHHHDPFKPIDTAYFGCCECGQPIPEAQRLDAWFQCKQTGVTLRSFLDELPSGDAAKQLWLKVGIHISPLTRKTEHNLAAQLIRDGMTCARSTDWQQQALGHPSENRQGNITLDLIKSAITAPKPDRPPDFILAGIDQGRGEDWLMIVGFFLPDGHERLSVAENLDQATRLVLFGGDVSRDAIADRLREYNVSYGLIDNEPDRSDASNLCRLTCLEMADQKPGLNDAVKEARVKDGGREYPCWDIRNEKFLKQVLNGFTLTAADGYPLYRLPSTWDQWLGSPSERSPIRHLMGPSYDAETGKWQRGDGNIDDLYYATMFCEAAFYLKLINKPKLIRRSGIKLY